MIIILQWSSKISAKFHQDIAMIMPWSCYNRWNILPWSFKILPRFHQILLHDCTRILLQFLHHFAMAFQDLAVTLPRFHQSALYISGARTSVIRSCEKWSQDGGNWRPIAMKVLNSFNTIFLSKFQFFLTDRIPKQDISS